MEHKDGRPAVRERKTCLTGVDTGGEFSRIRLLFAGVAQLVEHLVANEKVVGSSPITRSKFAQPGSARRAGFFASGVFQMG